MTVTIVYSMLGHQSLHIVHLEVVCIPFYIHNAEPKMHQQTPILQNELNDFCKCCPFGKAMAHSRPVPTSSSFGRSAQSAINIVHFKIDSSTDEVTGNSA